MNEASEANLNSSRFLTVAEKGLQTLELSFYLSESVPYTPALMDGGNGNRELHYIQYEITFLRDIVISRFWPSRLQTSDYRFRTSDMKGN